MTDRNRRYLRYFKADSLPTQHQELAAQGEDQTPGHIEAPVGDGQVPQPPVEEGMGTQDNIEDLEATFQPDLSVPTPPAPIPVSPYPTAPLSPQPSAPRRPTRTRVPNSRYPPEEFDLTG